jgi:hypothetical protein
VIEIVVDADGARHRLTVDAAEARLETGESVPAAMVPLLVAALVDLGPRPVRDATSVLLAGADPPWVRPGERRWRIAAGEPGGSTASVLDVVDAGDGGLWTPRDTADLLPEKGTVLRPITSTDAWTWISRHVAWEGFPISRDPDPA